MLKRAVLFVAIALMGGFGLGTLFGSGVSSVRMAAAQEGAVVPSYTLSAARGEALSAGAADASPGEEPPDTGRLLERAGSVLEALGEQDYQALSRLVHPDRGVALTPYSTVSPDCDRVLLPQQVALLGEDETVYTWGIEDGVGEPIQLTGAEYFARYVYNADYAAAPEQGVDEVLMQGNALENVDTAYPEGRFVEYHFPGLDTRMEGYDWCSLKLVFEPCQGDWYLVGLVHSEWTV